MTYHHEGATGSYTLTGRDAELELTRNVIREAWKKNWPLISLYAVITLGGVGASYFTSRWNSVALSIAVALATLLIGLFMAGKVITITKTKTIR
jgi:ABC-type uncharacterized transport system permease subunit